MVMEATKEIVSKQPLKGSIRPDEFGREPLDNPQLQSVDNLNVQGPKDVVGKEKLFALASSVGMLDVLRWKPRLVSEGTHGAFTLEKGRGGSDCLLLMGQNLR